MLRSSDSNISQLKKKNMSDSEIASTSETSETLESSSYLPTTPLEKVTAWLQSSDMLAALEEFCFDFACHIDLDSTENKHEYMEMYQKYNLIIEQKLEGKSVSQCSTLNSSQIF